MRLDVKADKGRTPLKLSDQNVENDVTIRRSEHLKNKNPTRKIPKLSTGISHGQRIIFIVAFHRLYLS